MVDLPVAPARAGWLAALVVVPLALAGVALVWPGVPTTSPVTVPSQVTAGTAPTAASVPAPARQGVAAALTSVLGPAPITFAPDSPALTDADRATLLRVAALLRDAPAAAVRVSGYCADTPGPPDVTQRLSEQRAAAVADVLAAAGVDRARLETVGRSAAEPLATAAASRRVEIQVI